MARTLYQGIHNEVSFQDQCTMRRRQVAGLLLLSLTIILVCSTAAGKSTSSDGKACTDASSTDEMDNHGADRKPCRYGKLLEDIMELVWQWRLEDDPEFSTTIKEAGKQYNHKVTSLTPESITNRYNKAFLFTLMLDGLDAKQLPPVDRSHYDWLRDYLRVFTRGYEWRFHSMYNPVTNLENPIIAFDAATMYRTPFDTIEDFKLYVKRLQALSVQIGEQVALMEVAIDKGLTHHLVSVEKVPQMIADLVDKPSTDGCFYQPFKEKLDALKGIEEEEKESIRNLASGVVTTEVYPALRGLQDFLQNIYIPATRPQLGVSSLTNGLQFYQQCLDYHLTIHMEPQHIHELGLREVKRIRDNMEEVKTKVKFNGTLSEFKLFLRDERKFYYSSKEELKADVHDIIHNQIMPVTGRLFSKLPDLPLVIKDLPYDGPLGLYEDGSKDGKYPGTFYINTNYSTSVAKFSMPSLCLHEAIPGHHFQISTMLQSSSPSVMNHLEGTGEYSIPFSPPHHTSYIEGWGLYAEYLGEELGVYQDPYDMMGRYSDEIFRACRLVVDTGLHVMGWTVEQAEAYIEEATLLSMEEIRSEVVRYVTWPGQACAYKVGELKIKEMRKRAEEELGSKFDVKAFHSVVLRMGRVPLTMFEDKINEWIYVTK